MMQVVYYSAIGAVVDSDSFTDPLKYAVPDSIGYTAIEFACDPAGHYLDRNVLGVEPGFDLIEFAAVLAFDTFPSSDCGIRQRQYLALGFGSGYSLDKYSTCMKSPETGPP